MDREVIGEDRKRMIPSTRRLSDRVVAWLLFLVVLIALLALRWSVLSMPLYEDQSVGFGREADFLNQTDFDYFQLRYEEKHFLFGGTARSYMISVIPTALSALSRLTGSTATTLFLWHCLSFVFAALIVTLVFALLQPLIGRRWAMLSAAALLTTPMFLAQADLAGMELPLTAFSLLAARQLVRGHSVRAAGSAAFAFLMKATGMIAGVAVLFILLTRWFVSPSSRRALTPGIVVSAVLLAGAVAAVAWGDDTAAFRATFLWPSAFRFPRAFLWCPDLSVLILIATAASAAWIMRDGLASSCRRWIDNCRRGEPSAILGGLSFLIATAGIVSMFGYIFIPRYYILPLVFLYLLAPILLFLHPTFVRVGAAALGILIVVNLVNLRGALYPSVTSVAGDDLTVLALFPPRSCGFSERSLEYLSDHRSSIQKIRAIEQDHANDSIFLDMPHWIYLTSPFVGYVQEPPPLAYRAQNYTATIREFRDRALTLPQDKDLLFLWSGRSGIHVPGPGEGIETLDADNLSPPLALLRAQRDRLPSSAEALEDWYLDRTWSKDYAVHRIISRYEFLRRTGRIGRAYAELHMAKWIFPNIRDPEIERQLANITLDLESALRSSVEFEGSPWVLFCSAAATGRLKVNEESKTLGVSVVSSPIGGGESLRLQGPRRRIGDGDAVTVRFQIRADLPAQAIVALERLFEPEQNYGFRQSVAVASEWKDYSFRLAPAEPERDAVLVFSFGQPGGDFEIKDVEFKVEGDNAAKVE